MAAGAEKRILICPRCGAAFENVRGGANRRFCEKCGAERAKKQRYGDGWVSVAKLENRLAPRPTTAKDGPLAGMTIETISALARQRHMSYGKFRALCEYLGYIPEVE